MNIGLIRMRYTPFGGAEVFVSRFIDELVNRGHTCHIFAGQWRENTGAGDSGKDSKLIFHKVKTFGPSFLRLLSFAVNSRKSVKNAGLDIVISFDRTLYQDIYRAGDGCHKEWLIQRLQAEGRRLQAEGKSRFILMIKRLVVRLNPLHLTILGLEKRLFNDKRMRFVIANSRRGKEEIVRHYKLPEDRICVIYNGIDLEKFARFDRDRLRKEYRDKLGLKDETALLFVGSGFERKGLDFLIKAVSLLKESGIKLIVAGKGKIDKYRGIAERCSVDNNIVFTGPVKDTHGYYSAADIFVLPSIYEPFSNACLEAMAFNLPVVTSRINGASEILTHGKDGMIINNPSDPAEIAGSIGHLLSRDRRMAAGAAARKTVENYTIRKNVEQFIKLLEGIK